MPNDILLQIIEIPAKKGKSFNVVGRQRSSDGKRPACLSVKRERALGNRTLSVTTVVTPQKTRRRKRDACGPSGFDHTASDCDVKLNSFTFNAGSNDPPPPSELPTRSGLLIASTLPGANSLIVD